MTWLEWLGITGAWLNTLALVVVMVFVYKNRPGPLGGPRKDEDE